MCKFDFYEAFNNLKIFHYIFNNLCSIGPGIAKLYPHCDLHFTRTDRKIRCFWPIRAKICIIEVFLLKYYFQSHLIYKWHYYRQTILNQLKIMVSYVYIIVLLHTFEKSMWCNVNVMWCGCASISSVYSLRDLVKRLWLELLI